MTESSKIKNSIAIKKFWEADERFADLFNTVVFHGEQRLKPEDLQEMDSDVSGMIQMKDYRETLTRTRDIVRKWAYGTEFVLIGAELQENVHYAMPLRNMIYDALTYLKEYQRIEKENREKGGMKKEEFLSGLRKEDRLHPVITLTLYYGEKEWDGPLSLREMLTDIPEEMREMVPDYRMNLLQVRDTWRYEFSNPDVQSVFEVSRDAFAGNFGEIQKKYVDRSLPREVAEIIGIITKSEGLINMSRQEEEEMNMCEALDRLMREQKDLGRTDGEDRIAALMRNLFEAGRITDAERASKDKDYRSLLLKEFNLTE